MRLGICGLGLIGSSVARALGHDHTILGLDPDPEASAGAADLGVTLVSTPAGLSDCDLVLLAAPTSVNEDLLRTLMADGPRVPVADLGSVKGPIMATWSQDRSFPFVGTHPMAGSERSGVAAGSADLFRRSPWAVVVEPETPPHVLATVVGLIGALGAEAVPVSTAAHDQSVTVVSHLPHMLSAALGQVVAASPYRELAIGLGGGSFRDSTRVCASPPERTAEFIAVNGPNAADAVLAAAERLRRVAERLRDHDTHDIALFLEPGHEVRAAFEVAVDVPTRQIPGLDADALRDLLLRERDTGLRVVAVGADTLTVRGGRDE